MKKFAALLLSLILFFGLFALPVNAQEVYEIEGKPFSVAMPENWFVVDRNTPADDPFFDWYGATKEEISTMYFDVQGLDATFFSPNDNLNLSIQAIENDAQLSFLSLSDEELETVLENNVNDMAVNGINMNTVESTICRFENSVWARILVDINGDFTTTEGITYSTLENGYLYTVAAISLDLGAFTDERIKKCDEFLSAVSFLGASPLPESKPAYTNYLNRDTGVDFDLSNGWELEEDNENSNLEFFFHESGIFMSYYYETNEELDKSKTDLELLDEWFLGDTLETLSALERETLGGREYIRGEATYLYPDGVRRDNVQHYLCEQGGAVLCYEFLYPPEDTEAIGVIEAFMEGLAYRKEDPVSSAPVSSAPETSSAPAEKPDKEAEPMPMWILLVIYVGFFAVVGGVILVIVVSMKKKKTEEKTDFELRYEKGTYAPLYAPQTDEPKEEAPLYCTQCGEKLAENSNFCQKCGAKVEK